MQELLEDDLREFYVAYDAAYDPEPGLARVRARAQRPRARGQRLWAALAACATALAGSIAAVVVLLSSGASVAYAGWTPQATTATPTEVAAATAACNRARAGNGLAPLTGTPVLTDQRGAFTAALYLPGDDTVTACLSNGTDNAAGMSSNQIQLDGFYRPPGPDQLQLPSNGGGGLPGFTGADPNGALPPQWLRRLNTPPYRNNPSRRAQAIATFRANLASGVESSAFGMAGSDVSAVTFVFAGDVTVDATVQNGWYFAWWPNLNYPSSVVVATTSGTTTSPMMPSDAGQSAGCTFGASDCVWAGTGTPLLPNGRHSRHTHPSHA